MDEQSVSVPIEIKAADYAELEGWARDSGHSVHDLLEEALRHFQEYTRAERAMMEEARKGPFSTLEEVEARLTARWQAQAQAAE